MCLVALLKGLSDKCAEVGSGRQESGCREVVGVAVAPVQLSGGGLDHVETMGQREDRSTESCYQVEPVEEEMGIRAVVGVLLEQLGRRAFPTLPSVVPSCRRECSQSSRNPIMETPCTPLISEPVEAILGPNSRWVSRANPASASSQQPHYPHACSSLSLQSLEEAFPNIEVPCEFSTPGEAASMRQNQSVSGLACTSV